MESLKPFIIKFPAVIFILFFLPMVTTADDNEIFGISQSVEPNILIIIDNSLSMEAEMCADGSSDCAVKTTRMAVAKATVADVIKNYGNDNRFGIMIFNRKEGGKIVVDCSKKNDYILDSYGNTKIGNTYDTAIAEYKEFIEDAINDIETASYTPLAETLFEAGRYFAGQDSEFNAGTKYTSPIQYRCQQNYIILMTDGEPTEDCSLRSANGNKTINGHELDASSDYRTETISTGNYKIEAFYGIHDPELQDVSGLLFDNDINSSHSGKQTIITYTIGFSEGVSEDAQLILQDAADRGQGMEEADGARKANGGLFCYSTSRQSLADAFESFISNLEERTSTFAAPAVPISDANKAYAGNCVYLSMFQPINGESRWIGNLKKYSLNEDLEISSCNSSEPILDSDGKVKESADSCWNIFADGSAVNKGGAGEMLKTRTDKRTIYTNDAEHESGLRTFSTALNPSGFGLDPEDTDARDKIVKTIRMEGDDFEESWKLGDLNHSQPAIATYNSGNSTKKFIFTGSNDGMLHCFDDEDGSEKWAFVPKEQFPRLKEVYTGNHAYFIDGTATIADTSSKNKIIICGERRGGNHYYSIDISTIDEPEYLYTFETEGQSWKKPQFVKTARNSTVKEAFFLTGGYDSRYDDNDDPSGPVKGNSLLFIDAKDKSKITIFAGNDDDDFDADVKIPAMAHSIVSAFAVDMIDDGKNTVSHVYAGDLGGNIFTFRDNDPNDPENPKELDGSWDHHHLFSMTNDDSIGRKIFSEADFVPEYIHYFEKAPEDAVIPEGLETADAWKTVLGDFVFFGTGDRANPLRTDKTNYFYCVKNDWRTGPVNIDSKVSDFEETLNDTRGTEDDEKHVLVNVTDIHDQEKKEDIGNELKAKYNRGWYIELEDNGEKCLSAPVVYDGIVYFTTFTPEDMDDNPCSNDSDGGIARLYAVEYKTGRAIYNHFDGNSDELTKKDRYQKIEAFPLISIPPGPQVVITFTDDEDDGKPKDKLLVPPTFDIRSKNRMQLFYWKQK